MGRIIMAAQIPKYRPYLTLQSIEALLNLLSQQHQSSQALIDARQSLQLVMIKANTGIIKPTYVTTGVDRTVEDKLGISTTSSSAEVTSPEIKRVVAFNKWSETPHLCTEEELELAHSYRYVNGLMTQDEELKYMLELTGVKTP
jgi:hypothetical protein